MKSIIIRHRKENLKKCSLRHLEEDPSLHFLRYPLQKPPSFEGYLLLKVDAPVLTSEDRDFGLLLLDGTWRLAKKMDDSLSLPLTPRSLPSTIKTAYPRKQDVAGGLASIEALYVAHLILGRPYEHLLDYYYWKEPFLEKNHTSLLNLSHAKL
ncbi:MAG: hypothetical protein S4CHLAM45_05610 [Chlamydiales bacterium]|nr:hypothetical protein [Chlamydiales bacterium]MCH9619898.1 hypothetical protein [Chlamydiales bacterium]MCH9622675.1 hypothetical protein [Chlamydiales bacterium]